MINIRDSFDWKRAKGTLNYRVFKNDILIEEFSDQNLLVDGLKSSLAHLVAGDTTNRAIAKIGFGSSGTAPSPSNTTLTDLYARGIGPASYPSATSVLFAWELPANESNGLSILEFGLLTANNTLVARRVRSTAILKASDIRLQGSWGISF